jgi:hypothetical protein
MAAGKHVPPSRRSHIHRLRAELTSLRNTSLTAPPNPQEGEMWLEAAGGTASLKAIIGGNEVTLLTKSY